MIGCLETMNFLAAASTPPVDIPLWYWFAFGGMIGLLLLLDLAVINRKAHRVHFREAAWTTAFWVALALAFNGWIWGRFGSAKGFEFLTGYLIEEALSVDNLFVFLVIFRHFAVRAEYQHRILFWGILGAIFFRLGFVLAGAALIRHLHAVIYVFGAFLVYTGAKLFTHKESDVHPEKSWVLRLFRRWVPTTTEFEGPRFILKRDGRRFATPLLLVLVLVEATDIVFAVDSVPAILAITTDTFIVFTSNIFAILGLRSIYFLLASLMEAFRYLKYGLSVILVFVGVKMLLADLVEIPIPVALGVVVGVIAASVGVSLAIPHRHRGGSTAQPAENRSGPGEPDSP
jgi:tellurite resistance protein TerC